VQPSPDAGDVLDLRDGLGGTPRADRHGAHGDDRRGEHRARGELSGPRPLPRLGEPRRPRRRLDLPG
jgi:hypothetical protein